jgi:hypothetical protein
LKTHFPAMYHLHLILKGQDEPPMQEEKDIAASKKIVDPARAAEYLVKLKKALIIIVNLFNQQHQHAAVRFLHWSVL